MIYIKAVINDITYDTERDEQLISFLSGTLYRKDDNYYLFCKSIILNGCIQQGNELYNSEFPSWTETKEDIIDNFDEETRNRIPKLGKTDLISREIVEQITLLPKDELFNLFISEINRSKIDIGNAVIIAKEYPVIKCEGRTFGVNIHDCTFLPMVENEIPEYNDFFVKVNPEDTVIKSQTDRRGYPASCGTQNANKDIIVIVRGN